MILQDNEYAVLNYKLNERNEIMKKFKILLFILLAFCIGACDSVKDAADKEFDITFDTIFTIDGDSATYSYNVDFDDISDNYTEYKNKIKDIEVTYVKYSITANTGNAGNGILYAGTYGNTFASASPVAEMVSFSGGETRGETNIVWTNKSYFESLLSDGKLSIWAIGSGSDVHIVAPTEFKLKVTANALD